MKKPASLTESGFVPPGLKVKEKAGSPLAKLPEVPKGLVRVIELLEILHVLVVKTPVEAVIEQDDVDKVILDGKVMTNLELDWI